MAKEYNGEQSTEYAEALYLKAKALYLDKESHNEISFLTIKKSIQIWKNTPLSGGPRDLNHAMALIFKATILCKALKKYRWSVKVYRKAAIIISEITGARMNTESFLNHLVQECEKVIELAQEESGEDLDIDNLSEEEDADIFQDHKLQMDLKMLSNPVIAMSHQILKLQLSAREAAAKEKSSAANNS